MSDRARYHHGSVLEQAVAAATDVVRSSGLEAVRLRDVAATVGVSHAALYRHVDGRSTLLTHVAASWIDDAVERLQVTASVHEFLDVYVWWALESKDLYRCAFGADRGGGSPVDASLARLTRLAAERFDAEAPGTGAEVRDRVFRSWGTAHGLLDLYWHGLLRASTPAGAHRYILGLTTSTG